ncbi:MAG: DMT family transporter [Bacteroidales bacterium]|nr:DMT family transporter [Bacteroidales bacterium]NLK81743.1 EamA family transporter [Bacteroidales bacterium]
MRNKIKAHGAIFIANVLYGVNYVAVKQILPEYATWQALAFLRGFGALILLLAISPVFKHEKIAKKDIGKIAIAGVLGVAINQSLLVWGISLSSPINASIIMTLNPLFVMIFSALYLKFSITKHKVLGIIIGGVGAVILILSARNAQFDGTHTVGDIIILCNAILYGAYLVITKPLMKKYDSFTVLKYTFLFGCFPVVFYGAEPTFQINFAEMPMYVYAAIAFVVIGATFLTYLLNIVGLKYVNPTTVSVYIYLQPIVAGIISISIGEDAFSWYKLFSMLLVFIGVYLVTLSNKHEPQKR